MTPLGRPLSRLFPILYWLVLLVIAGGGLAVILDMENSLRKQVKAQFEAEARTGLTAFEESLGAWTNRFLSFAELPSFRTLHFHALSHNQINQLEDIRYLELYALTLKNRYAELLGLRFIDNDGKEVFKIDGDGISRNLSDVSLGQDAAMALRLGAGQLRVVRTQHDGMPDRLTWWVPVHVSESVRLGILAFDLDFASMQGGLAALSRPGFGWALLEDAKGNLIADTVPPAGKGQEENPGWSVSFPLKLPGLQWRATIQGDPDALLRGVNTLHRVVMFGLLPLSLALLASLGFVARKRMKTEEALQESESRFRKLLQDIPSVSIQSYGPDGIARYWNKASERFYGYTEEEAIGRNMIERIIPPEQQDGFSQAMRQMFASRQPIPAAETSMVRKDGSRMDVFSCHAYVQVPGREAEMFRVDIDLTERKRAEAGLVAAKEDAERANNAKSQFLSSMSHELRTPLNAILGFAQLLEMCADPNTPEQQESVRYILTAGQQLLGLVNDLLDLSRIDIGKLQLNVQPLRIAELVSSCAEQVASAIANQRNIAIQNTITDTGLLVLGDNLRLRQVLINLLGNAVKYNRDYGRVTIACKQEKEGRLRIEVRDNGDGIPSEKLPLLFTPFERLDQKHGTIPGVGIGLHITKQLVEAMHGTIGVESERGKGSTFWFDLPLALEAEEPVAEAGICYRSESSENASLVVLYIEDNPVNVQLVEKAFQSRPDVELLTAGTAEEGLAIAEERRLDLILMDIRLPGIDGVAATRILKGKDATRNIPVVALSADAMKEDVDRALGSGCCAYLTKPVKLQALYDVVDKFV